MASGKEKSGRIVALWLALALLLAPENAAPLTPAGTVIRHSFTARYALQSAAREVSSNPTTIAVHDLSDPTLVPVRSVATGADQPISLLHTLTNRGNSTDTFQLKATPLEPLFPEERAPVSCRFFAADGVTPLSFDAAGNQSTPPLAPGASLDVVLQVTPRNGSAGRVSSITVTASSNLVPARSVSLSDQVVVLAQQLAPQSAPQLRVTKVPGREVVEAGDIIPYTVHVENLGTALLEHTRVSDLLPRGFRYLKGSTLVDGAGFADPTGSGQQLSWDLGSLEPGRQRVLSYRCVVSADAPVGEALNQVAASGTSVGGTLGASLPAAASVRVRSSLLAERAIILGRLFEDLNRNGVPDPGEPGVAGVRLYLEDGSFVISDSEGQYSFTGLSVGAHVVKIDRSTLARRLKPAPFNTSFAGVGWSQFITVPFGGPARGDFAMIPSGVGDKPAKAAPLNAGGAAAAGLVAQHQTDQADRTDQPEKLEKPEKPGEPDKPTTAGAGAVASLRLTPERADLPADGASMLPVTVELRNVRSERVTGERLVTVTLARGSIVEADQAPELPGHQVKVTDGLGVFRVRAPKSSGADLVQVSGENGIRGQVDLYYSSQLRDWIVVGLGNLDVGAKAVSGHLERIGKEDRFEEGIFHEERLAFFARGKILGKYLLTAAYDSDKERRDGVFQYIDPEKYYPVYGDASDQGYEAQSRGKIYLKLEAGRSYLLAGDYRSDLSENEFSRYDRALNGVKLELNDAQLSAKGFESRTEELITRDEIPGNGTSGFYFLSRTPVFENSERVRIEIRDRYHSERVLSVVQKLRYADYSIDYLAGTILFKEPIPSLDPNLNPVSIVVNYQSRGGGAERYVYGGRLLAQAENGSLLGGSAVIEESGVRDNRLFGLDAALKLGERVTLKGEGAVSDTLEHGQGSAWKLDLGTRPVDALELSGYYRKVEADFFNPSMTGNESGTEKYGGRADFRGMKDLLVFGESFVQRSELSATRLFGNQVGVLRKFSLWEGETGFKRVEQEAGGVRDSSDLLYAGLKAQLTPRLDATLRRDQLLGSSQVAEYQSRSFLKLDYRLTDATRFYVTEEYQEGHSLLRQATKFGLESRLNDRMRLTTGYQLASGSAAGSTRQGSVDLNSKLVEQDGFSLNSRTGYQLETSMSGERGQAIIGLNTRLRAAQGLYLDSSLERVETVQGTSATRTAFTLAGEYLRDRDLKLTGCYEIRTGAGETASLYGAGLAFKLNSSLTLLGKANLWDADRPAGYDLKLDSYLGTSWRPLAGNPWQLLSLLRFKDERTGSLPGSERSRSLIASAEPTYRLVANWSAQGKYAGKVNWLEDAAGRSFQSYSDLVLAGLSYDLAERWELSGYLKFLNQYETGQRSLGAVGRLGYRVYRNVVLSAGYSYARLDDRDLTGETFQGQGPFVGVKVKFDEEMFESANRSVEIAPAPAAPVAQQPPVAPRPPDPPLPVLLFAAARQDEPLRLSGSVELFTLLINGERAKLPSTGVVLSRERLPGALELRQGKLATPIRFLTRVERPELVQRWSISILNEAGAPVATLRGAGAPQSRIAWGGEADGGAARLEAGGVYQYRLEVVYRDGSRFSTGPEMFGIDRKEVVLLTLSGGAFVFDSAVLTPEAERLLGQAAETLRLHPEDKVTLEGHTDWIGSAAYNMGLSQRRCEAAADYLVREQKIPASRLVRRWYGKSRPVADNRTDQGRERNRRVEVKADFQSSVAAAKKGPYRGAPFLVLNGAAVPIDAQGRFETQVPAATGTLRVQMGDGTGRTLATEIAVPQVIVSEPGGELLVPYGSAAGAVRVAADGKAFCRVAGRCTQGNRLELDGKAVPLDAEGRFAVEVAMPPGEQVLGMVLRGEGWVRLMNLKLRAVPQQAGGRP
jgi:uncharacterized repeat protein (TIGR01451 family)